MRPAIHRKASGSALNYIYSLLLSCNLDFSSLLKRSLASFGNEKKNSKGVETFPNTTASLFEIEKQSKSGEGG